MTPGQPCVCPFLPFYIGINEVPNIASGRENTLGAVFEKLRQTVNRRPKYRAEITDFWTGFEIQAIEESYGKEREAARLADAGKEKEARKLLTEFCEDKCNEALAVAQDMLKYLNKLPILGEATIETGEE
jgi:hypothetical protein